VLLASKKNGKFLTIESTGHLEYLINTMACHERDQVINVFQHSDLFPALHFKLADSAHDINSAHLFDSIQEQSSDSSSDEEDLAKPSIK
jgi:hypothetical protein